ncbi:MAG: FxLYD domain-containing protein [Actinomycetota bacterium]|nr:FxLYD domain-containing protein [Actinomycetota bacterium]
MAALLAAPLLVGCSTNKVAEQDVTITACRDDPAGGRPTADGTIVNHSSKASTYVLDVVFIDSSGNKVSEGGATVGKVEPAATAVFHAQGLAGAKGPLTCRIATVNRTVAP